MGMAQVREWWLRPCEASDLDGVHALLGTPEVYRYLGDGAPIPRAAIDAWLLEGERDLARGAGLWLLASSTVAWGGLVRLSADEADAAALELTYALAPDLWGRGLATRMAWTVIERAFEAPIVERVWAGADAPNRASIEVMRRLGMRLLREVPYALGPGVEYELRRSDARPDDIEPLALVTPEDGSGKPPRDPR